MATTNIIQEHRDSFNALTSGDYSNFALFSCFVNGEPASAIVAISKDDSNEYHITPLFGDGEADDRWALRRLRNIRPE